MTYIFIENGYLKGEKMATELTPTEVKEKKIKVRHQGGGSNSVYGLGLIGAWVYYISRATTNEEKVRGFFKGLVWPAFLVHDVLKFLNKE
jgi:hypothetical protein